MYIVIEEVGGIKKVVGEYATLRAAKDAFKFGTHWGIGYAQKNDTARMIACLNAGISYH